MNHSKLYARMPKRQIGLTLVEILVALTVGLVLMAGISSIYVGSKRSYRMTEDGSRLQETGRYAVEVVGRSLRQAGYTDIANSGISRKRGFATDINGNPVGIPIQGLENACLVYLDAGTSSADLFATQYDGVAGETDCQGNVLPANSYVQNSFYIETDWSRTPPAGAPANWRPPPVLKCIASTTARTDLIPPDALPAVPTVCPIADQGSRIVDNIEDMQIVYGIDNDGDESVDMYSAAQAGWIASDWQKIVTARVCILARSPNAGLTSTGQNYLNCAGALGIVSGAAAYTAAADTRIRRTFVATYNLRNRVLNVPD